MVEIPIFGERIQEVPITLPTGVQIDLKIVYEMVPYSCEICKKLGHKTEICRRRAATSNGEQPPPTQEGQEGGNGARRRSRSTRGRGRTNGSMQRRREWRPRSQSERGESQAANRQEVPNGVEREEEQHEEEGMEREESHQMANPCREIVPISPIPLAMEYTHDPDQEQDASTPGLQQNAAPMEDNDDEEGSEPWQTVKGRRLYKGGNSRRGTSKGGQSNIQTRARAAREGGK